MKRSVLIHSTWLLTTFALGACNAVIGIEDIHQGPNPNAGSAGASRGGAANQGGASQGGSSGKGTSGAATSGGATSTNGGTTSTSGGGGTTADGGGSALSGGKANGGGNAGGSTASGGTGAGGTSAGGTGGAAAGAGGSTSTGTVSGVVIDFLGHKLQNAAVAIVGTNPTTVLTDAQGKFTLPNVPATYDISVVVNPSVRNNPGTFTWVYQGLTRRDPTLQVYIGTTNQTDDYNLMVTNDSFTSNDWTEMSFGSVDGTFDESVDSPNAQVGTDISFGWYGPVTTTGTLHALHWTMDANSLPKSYVSYTQQNSVTLDASKILNFNITFPNTAVTSSTVSGSVTSPTSANRQNWAYLRFTSNATMTLLQDSAGPANFSYLVPTVANSVITVAATEGDTFPNGGPYAVAHKDVTPGQTGITLDIPSPAVLIGPNAGAKNVNSSTQFQWAGNAKVSLLIIYDQNLPEALYILTASKQVTIPNIAGSFPLRSGEAYSWNVETDGDWASTDAATGPSGFQDAFGTVAEDFGDSVLGFSKPMGATRGDGSCTVTAPRDLTTQ